MKITNAIDDLGGSVFPKLNWSAPKVRHNDMTVFLYELLGHRNNFKDLLKF